MDETTKLPKCCSLKIFLLTCLLFSNSSAKSEVYTVGDADQWNTGINYLLWSEKYNFTVGDVLVFKYVKGQHNVYKVRKATYQSCNTSNGVLARYESGNDQVNLRKAKKYWFICEKDEHCLGGMRFVIEVKVNSSSSSSNITNGTSSTTTPQPEPTTSSNGNYYVSKSKGWGTMIYLLAFGAVPSLFLVGGLG